MKRPDLTDDEKNRLFADALREMLQADKGPGKLIPFPKPSPDEKKPRSWLTAVEPWIAKNELVSELPEWLPDARRAESLNSISNMFDEVVEKYAPGGGEFDHWIAESAELSSRLDIHKAYCVFCREE